jgi:hypothetical protein
MLTPFHLAAIAASRKRDPLAGISLTIRLQTHRGDGVPLGLYQDTACTIPAINDGHSIAAWRDELSDSGLTAVQSVSTKRPTLKFVSGKPVVRFDGVDDYLSVTLPRPFPFSLALAARSANSSFGGMSGYGSGSLAIGNGFNGFAPESAFWLWGPDSGTTFGQPSSIDTHWHTHLAKISTGSNVGWQMFRDGVEVGSPGITSSSLSDAPTTLHLGQDGNGAHWGGDISTYLQAGGLWDSSSTSRVTNHLNFHRPA